MNRCTLRRIIRKMMKELRKEIELNKFTIEEFKRTYIYKNITFEFTVEESDDDEFIVTIKLYHKKRETYDDFYIAGWYCKDSKEGIEGITKEVKKYINMLKERFENE